MIAVRRRLVLLALMALTGAAMQWWGSDEPARHALAVPGVASPGAEAQRPAKGADDAAHVRVDLEKLKRPPFAAEASDLFASRNWSPTEQRKAAARTMPPLPFRFFGRLVEEGRTVVFLAHGARTFTVGTGDTIEGTYRVDEIGRENVVLTYLPLGEKQTLPIGAIN